MTKRHLLLVGLTLATLPVIAAVVAFALMWGIHQWNPPTWGVAVVGSALFASLSYLTWRWLRKLAARQFRFSMRGMLIAFAIVAVLLSTLGRWWLDFFGQQRAVRSIGSYGGTVIDEHDYEYRHQHNLLYDRIGYDPFDPIRVLDIPTDSALFSVLDQPRRFSEIRYLSFGRGVTSAAFQRAGELNQFDKLQLGEFFTIGITDKDLRELTAWTTVSELFFNGCAKITDSGLAHFVDFPNVTSLSFVGEPPGMSIGDAGLAHIGRMKQLKYLMLMRLPLITDAGLSQLHELTNLETLMVRHTSATEDGLRQLYAALPDCRIVTNVRFHGPTNVRQIVVRHMAAPKPSVNIVSNPDRIADVLGLLDKWHDEDQKTWDQRVNDPWPAEWVFEFMGKSRDLFQVRLDGDLLQTDFRKNWNKASINDETKAKLLQLLAPDAAEGEK